MPRHHEWNGSMKRNATYLIAGLFGAIALGITILASYWNDRLPNDRIERTAIGSPISERQELARRRASVGVVAIAGATVQ